MVYNVFMKTNTLALRISLNSLVMINAVYVFMQTINFFKDNLLFGIKGISKLPLTVGSFVGIYVFLPSLLFGVILYLQALPLQRVQLLLESGETITPEVAEKTRIRILRFSKLVIVLNLIGFAAGYLLLMIISGRVLDLLEPANIIVLTSNITGGAIYASAQNAINIRSLDPLREMLGFREIGGRKKERKSTTRQVTLSVLIVVYGLTFMQFNQADTFKAQSFEIAVSRMYASGEIAKEELASTYYELLERDFVSISSRAISDFSTLPLPWERDVTIIDIQRQVFFLCFFFIFIIALFVELTTSFVIRHQLKSLKNQIKEVLTGGRDLRKRLNLLNMDEIGELTELINKLLDQFSSIVSRISTAAEESNEGAHEINRVLTESENISKQTGQAVLMLGSEIENQVQETQKLKISLDSFRNAVTEVAAAAEMQNQFAQETSTAMEEMASNIQSVESMTSRSGTLTETLRIQGVDGGLTARESVQAIEDIAESATDVLNVIKDLDKISASINLLAMNAAIEAAHAGKHGEGFAVVANEVRQLAFSSTNQTKTIKKILKTMALRVKHGVEKSESSALVLNGLIEGIQQAAAISHEISGAMKEQAVGTGSVAKNLEKVLEASLEIRQRTEEQTIETNEMALAITHAIESFEILANDSRTSAEGIHALESSFIKTRTEVSNNLGTVKSLTAEVQNFKI